MGYPLLRLPFTLVEEALIARLKAKMNPIAVYEHVPSGRPFPYLVVGNSSFSDGSTKDCGIMVVECPVHVWTQGESMRLVSELASEVVAAVMDADLDLTASEMHCYLTRFTGAGKAKHTDGQALYQEIAVRFRFEIQDLRS